MVQVLPLSQQAVDAAEAVEDAVVMASADGVICERELAYLLPKVQLMVMTAREADLARAAGMAVIKGGVGAKRAQDLLHQIDAHWEDVPA
jgi:hypothetical protein